MTPHARFGRLARRVLVGAAMAVAVALVQGEAAVAAEPLPAAWSTPLRFGAAWYPEQEPESRWEADLALMDQAHMNVVRVGEFAWSRMEPSEGHYDFAWLDRVIAALARHHIAVVLGTPTAAPPAWLTSRYPDVLRVDEDGRAAEHGGRQQFSFASARYRAFAREIATAMAERYGHDPRVVGWQVDNELSAPSFDPEARALFHRWLQARYGTIDALNAHWTTAYWSQTYDSFDQVPMRLSGENPGLMLDLKRFISDTWIDYAQNQVRAIRAHAAAAQFITTNTQHWNAGFDHYRMHRGLDLAAWDDYAPDGRYDWVFNGEQHDLVRGYKRRDFWVMETQAGAVNWWPVNRSLDPGQMREMAWQAVGHGADALLYWQFKSSPNGQEQYHGGLVGPDGGPLPVFGEVARTGAEFQAASAALAGTAPSARVAVLQDYDSRWAIDFQRHAQAFDPVAEFTDFYRPLELGAQAVDVIGPDAPLAGYALVVAPALNVLTPQEAQRLADYVRAGGHLVLGPRSGMKDGFNALNVQRQPGPLAGLLGARVRQFYALERPVPVLGGPAPATARVWAEDLEPRDADVRVLRTYGPGQGWLDGRPAVVSRRVGRGEITYVGAWLEPAGLAALADQWLVDAGVSPVLAGAPPQVEVCERTGEGKTVMILINHGDAEATLDLPAPMRRVLGAGLAPAGPFRLPAHDVAVLEAQR